jgi:hypothetical protein
LESFILSEIIFIIERVEAILFIHANIGAFRKVIIGGDSGRMGSFKRGKLIGKLPLGAFDDLGKLINV